MARIVLGQWGRVQADLACAVPIVRQPCCRCRDTARLRVSEVDSSKRAAAYLFCHVLKMSEREARQSYGTHIRHSGDSPAEKPYPHPRLSTLAFSPLASPVVFTARPIQTSMNLHSLTVELGLSSEGQVSESSKDLFQRAGNGPEHGRKWNAWRGVSRRYLKGCG